jgi:hypothetical protein
LRREPTRSRRVPAEDRALSSRLTAVSSNRQESIKRTTPARFARSASAVARRLQIQGVAANNPSRRS